MDLCYRLALRLWWASTNAHTAHLQLNAGIYLFIYLRTQHSKQYKIEDTIKAVKF